jgi:hypothetical protein
MKNANRTRMQRLITAYRITSILLLLVVMFMLIDNRINPSIPNVRDHGFSIEHTINGELKSTNISEELENQKIRAIAHVVTDQEVQWFINDNYPWGKIVIMPTGWNEMNRAYQFKPAGYFDADGELYLTKDGLAGNISSYHLEEDGRSLEQVDSSIKLNGVSPHTSKTEPTPEQPKINDQPVESDRYE